MMCGYPRGEGGEGARRGHTAAGEASTRAAERKVAMTMENFMAEGLF